VAQGRDAAGRAETVGVAAHVVGVDEDMRVDMTSPGVTSRPRALIVRRASFFGNDAATSTILPPLIATSSWPLSPAAGSSTSPSVTNRSYFIVPSPRVRTAPATLPPCRSARHPARPGL